MVAHWTLRIEIAERNDRDCRRRKNMSAARAVGVSNGATRDLWIKQVLSDLPAGAHLLDAGAGECQFKKYCDHLHYVSQDIAVYGGRGETGLHTGAWDTSKIDIICDITTGQRQFLRVDRSGDSAHCRCGGAIHEQKTEPARALCNAGCASHDGTDVGCGPR
jgi:hypothetical protein